MNLKSIFSLFKETFQDWSKDKAPRLAAALAYYTIFSLAPLLILVIAITGFILGNNVDIRQQLLAQIEGLMGAQGADAVSTMIENTSTPGQGILATIIGVATLLLGATGVFGQLQEAMNTIWNVPPKKSSGILNMLKDRFLSFTMILGISFLLLVSLVISTWLAAINGIINNFFGGAEILAQIFNFVISTGIVTLIFAMIFKILPDAEVEWKDVWIGALVTSLLFNIGKTLIGLYLGNSATASTYGAAGSLVVILLWVYYSAQILFFGAEFTQVYARRYGSRIVAERDKEKETHGKEQPGKRQAGGAGTDQPAPVPVAGQVMIPVAGQPQIYSPLRHERVRYQPQQPGKVVPVIALGTAAGAYTIQRIVRRLVSAAKPEKPANNSLRDKIQEKVALPNIRNPFDRA